MPFGGALGAIGGGAGGATAAATVGGAVASMGTSLAVQGAIMGGKALVNHIKNKNNDIKEERANALNRRNAFNQMLAERKVADPMASVKQLMQNRNMANFMGLSRGKGVDLSTLGKPGQKAQTIGAHPGAQDERGQQIIKTLRDLGSNNLGVNDQGILEFIAPAFEQAVSKKLADKGDFGNFVEGGVEKGLGTKGNIAREKKKSSGGFFGFLKRRLKRPFSAAPDKNPTKRPKRTAESIMRGLSGERAFSEARA